MLQDSKCTVKIRGQFRHSTFNEAWDKAIRRQKRYINVMLLQVMRNAAIDPDGIIFNIATPHLPISCHLMYTYSFLPDTLTAVQKRSERNKRLPSVHHT